MDRLTERNECGGAYYKKCFEICDESSDKYCEFCDIDLEYCEKLAYYEDLEEQGRLVKLPCAKGDTAYFLYKGEIKKDTINSISSDIYDNEFDIWLGTNNSILFRLNKTAFLTREEAEAKLKEMES